MLMMYNSVHRVARVRKGEEGGDDIRYVCRWTCVFFFNSLPPCLSAVPVYPQLNPPLHHTYSRRLLRRPAREAGRSEDHRLVRLRRESRILYVARRGCEL